MCWAKNYKMCLQAFICNVDLFLCDYSLAVPNMHICEAFYYVHFNYISIFVTNNLTPPSKKKSVCNPLTKSEISMSSLKTLKC